MPAAPAALLKRLTVAAVSDGECLRRYARDRDDGAFQTTFLPLARNARRLTGSPSVAGWLYRVAVRSAGAIRRADARRRRCEQAALPPDRAEDVTWTEVRGAID